MEEGGFLKWFPNVSLENQMLIACSVIIDMMQVENISVDEGTRIRHRELSNSLSEVALMMKSIIILFSYLSFMWSLVTVSMVLVYREHYAVYTCQCYHWCRCQ